MMTHETQLNSEIKIRRMDLTDGDLAQVAQLAELDSAAHLAGQVLGVEVEGRLLAAIEVDTGKILADPFSRTSELRALLKLRAEQLRDRHTSHNGHRRRRAAFLIGRRSPRPAVGGSPAGEIISLPRV
jgi:hypothetical protein